MTVRILHPHSRDRQGQEMFLAPSTDNQTHNYEYTENHKLYTSLIRIN